MINYTNLKKDTEYIYNDVKNIYMICFFCKKSHSFIQWIFSFKHDPSNISKFQSHKTNTL